jgi:hypothetical protein
MWIKRRVYLHSRLSGHLITCIPTLALDIKPFIYFLTRTITGDIEISCVL